MNGRTLREKLIPIGSWFVVFLNPVNVIVFTIESVGGVCGNGSVANAGKDLLRAMSEDLRRLIELQLVKRAVLDPEKIASQQHQHQRRDAGHRDARLEALDLACGSHHLR